MKITVSIDDKLSFDLSFGHVRYILEDFENIEENADIFNALASHPAAVVRVAASRCDYLSVNTVTTLAHDASASVRTSIVTNKAFKEHAPLKLLLQVIAADTDAASAVASELDGYKAASAEYLAKLLKTHTDPTVRAGLAGNRHTPERILMALTKDEDRLVRSIARSTVN